MSYGAYRVLHMTKSRLILVLLILIPCIEIGQLLYMKIIHEVLYHPAFAFFLAGMSRGHVSQTLLLWFLPLYLLIFNTDDSIQDYTIGIHKAQMVRSGRKQYLRIKMLFSFVSSSLLLASSLALHFLLTQILFWSGDYKNGLDEFEFENNWLFTYSMDNHYGAIFLFFFLAILMAGFAGLLGASMSLYFKDRKYAYAATFFVWFGFVVREKSLMFVFQPFTEYGLDMILPIYVQVIATISLLAMFVYWREGRRDVL